MTHLVEEARHDAERAVSAMRAAALEARALHARAELMRHMAMTSAAVSGRPPGEAPRAIVEHWLAAWGLERANLPQAAEMDRFAAAFYDYWRAPSDAKDRTLREATHALERAFARAGTTLPDQMAWQSVCAHEWWGEVRPAPPGKGRADRDWPDRPFWERGCPPQCL